MVHLAASICVFFLVCFPILTSAFVKVSYLVLSSRLYYSFLLTSMFYGHNSSSRSLLLSLSPPPPILITKTTIYGDQTELLWRKILKHSKLITESSVHLPALPPSIPRSFHQLVHCLFYHYSCRQIMSLVFMSLLTVRWWSCPDWSCVAGQWEITAVEPAILAWVCRQQNRRRNRGHIIRIHLAGLLGRWLLQTYHLLVEGRRSHTGEVLVLYLCVWEREIRPSIWWFVIVL